MLISVFAFAGLPLPKLKRLPGLKEAPLVVFFTNNSIDPSDELLMICGDNKAILKLLSDLKGRIFLLFFNSYLSASCWWGNTTNGGYSAMRVRFFFRNTLQRHKKPDKLFSNS